MDFLQVIKKQVVDENPAFVRYVGLCPLLAATTGVREGLGMGIASAVMLSGVYTAFSMLGSRIPREARFLVSVVIMAVLATLVQSLTALFDPGLERSLGIYLPLAVAAGILPDYAAAFWEDGGTAPEMCGGMAGVLGTALGFAAALVLTGAVRELLGRGSLWGIAVMPAAFRPVAVANSAAGAFLILGILSALFSYFSGWKGGVERE